MDSVPAVFEPPATFNIADYFLGDRIREGRGDRVALRLARRRLTYHQVDALANRFGQVLRHQGVRPDDRVMIALPDGPELVAALFGTLKLGAVAVMVNPAFKRGDVASFYAYTRCRSVVVHDSTSEAFFDAAEDVKKSAGEYLASLIHVGDPEDPDGFEHLAESAGDQLATFPTHPDDPALWLFSGGTTGRPKAVVQTHRSFANTTELYAKRALGYREDDITLSVPKLFFGYATGSNLFFPFAVGASAVLFPEHPTPEAIFTQIAIHRPTILVNVPTLVNRMVNDPAAKHQHGKLSCLRFATSAGEALPVPLYRKWKERFGVELLDGLGTAEMWHIFVTNRPGDVRPGTLGRVVDGFEIRVCDDDGREVTAGEVGRLWVRGDSRALGYWQSSAQTAEAFRGEWFVGGDLVSRDQEGYVTYCGRADDVMKVGGKWLVPREVEGCLLEHPAVKECAVIGAEDAEGLMKPYAFVIAEGEVASELEQELKDFALERLAAYKHPRRVIVLDAFPRTHLGKVDRGKLRALVG